jgi:hypothetical protein
MFQIRSFQGTEFLDNSEMTPFSSRGGGVREYGGSVGGKKEMVSRVGLPKSSMTNGALFARDSCSVIHFVLMGKPEILAHNEA